MYLLYKCFRLSQSSRTYLQDLFTIQFFFSSKQPCLQNTFILNWRRMKRINGLPSKVAVQFIQTRLGVSFSQDTTLFSSSNRKKNVQAMNTGVSTFLSVHSKILQCSNQSTNGKVQEGAGIDPWHKKRLVDLNIPGSIKIK